MNSRIAMFLFCVLAPAPVLAQTVELRSTDDFISVEGQIVGFNGSLLRVRTSVGVISVPASEVVCYGVECNKLVSSNTFGLTESAFQGIVSEPLPAAAPLPIAGTDALQIGFDSPILGTLYRTLAGAYAVASQTSNAVEYTPSGEISIQNSQTDQSAILLLAGSMESAGVTVQAVSLNGAAPGEYSMPSDWATGAQLTHQMLGLKAFSVIVAPNAGISEITLNDLAGIYAGEITNWSQIGGADVNILPLQMPNDSAVNKEVVRLVMEPSGKQIAGNILTMADEAGISAAISQFPGSVSIVGTANADDAFVVDVAGPCGIAVAPTPFNIVAGDYPLVRPIMARYAARPKTGLLTELFDFASGDVAQRLFVSEGFIDFNAVQQDPAEKNARLSGLLAASLDDAQREAAAEMFQVLFSANRLSTTFTGGVASGPEGGWNRAVLIDLLDTLAAPSNAGREIIFVGFGESTAGSAAAIAASAAAAAALRATFQEVAADVIASGGNTVSSYGFGNVAPSTCIDGQVAGSEYTRVEVWIR
ncbi:MAG: substrate-binding domain-containing protein [Paracoccaceae bacterium]|nr:substrate-binding domain-containing protein [Paracoccaceae bacterium]